MPPTMPHLISRRRSLQAGLALGCGWLLPPAQACEYFLTTLRVLHPWTRASLPGATTAVVCMRFDEVTQHDRLIGVVTPVAQRAEMSGPAAGARVDVDIPAGKDTVLGEDGVVLRLVGLQHPLELGRSYPMQLVFEVGGTVSTNLSVDYGRFR